MKQVYPRLKRSRPLPFPLEDCSFPRSGLSDLATLGQGHLKKWTGHSTLILSNPEPLEISLPKFQHFNNYEKYNFLPNLKGVAQKLDPLHPSNLVRNHIFHRCKSIEILVRKSKVVSNLAKSVWSVLSISLDVLDLSLKSCQSWVLLSILGYFSSTNFDF